MTPPPRSRARSDGAGDAPVLVARRVATRRRPTRRGRRRIAARAIRFTDLRRSKNPRADAPLVAIARRGTRRSFDFTA